MSTIHRVTDDRVHARWNRDLEPAIVVEPGEAVEVPCRDASDGQLSPRSVADDMASLDFGRIHALTGPVWVDGARPGDVLEVEVLYVEHGGWGWTSVAPGFGLLGNEFPERRLHIWDLGPATASFHDVATIQLSPFLGVMGLAWDEPGDFPTLPPRNWGGNLDVKQLVAGSRLYLPVQVEGARFSCGDGHGAQGDGEVCGTAIEAPVTATLRFNVHTDRRIQQPQFHYPGTAPGHASERGYHVTCGVGPDLMAASQDAIRFMIDHLGREYRLAPEDAYMLCSVAVDLRISEIVDRPNWVVSAFLPLDIFAG
jgi:acetamidase/formamidase